MKKTKQGEGKKTHDHRKIQVPHIENVVTMSV